MSKSRKGPVKDHEIEKLLQIWPSSEEESNDDEDFQATEEGPLQHPTTCVLTPELYTNLAGNKDLELFPHNDKAGLSQSQRSSTRALTPELVPDLHEIEDLEELPHDFSAGPFQHPPTRALTPELIHNLHENEDMDVLSHYDSAGPSQHPPTHAQTPELYSSLPENETATAGDGILHNPEFEQIPEEPTYAELQSKRREWTTQIENFVLNSKSELTFLTENCNLQNFMITKALLLSISIICFQTNYFKLL
ncbi:unnamed protein product [Parnassius apollo]|uniref:(apollo) hypothetical protein n=1 Tax=Parnassius apollo TaxID=110799 RepID=A0A8S3XPN1_PARAO|nr:unnamed protein product [Parnassius apollo]